MRILAILLLLIGGCWQDSPRSSYCEKIYKEYEREKLLKKNRIKYEQEMNKVKIEELKRILEMKTINK